MISNYLTFHASLARRDAWPQRRHGPLSVLDNPHTRKGGHGS